MNRDRIDVLFGGFAITYASISLSRRVVFGLKEIYDFETPNKRFSERVPDDSELAAKACLYNPVCWHDDKDDFIARRWSSGIGNILPVFVEDENGKHVVVCCTDGHMRGHAIELQKDNEWYSGNVYVYAIPHPHNAMHCARNIAGDIYFSGTPRKLFKRTVPDQWIDLTEEKSHPHLFEDINKTKRAQGNLRGLPMGFHAVDGFTGNDIYAGGRGGDLWHYLDGQWHRMNLPGNGSISAILCGGDGQVYIGCEHGPHYVGRHDPEQGERWQVLGNKEGAPGVTSLAWFDGKLWLGSPHGLYVYKNGEIIFYDYPDKRNSVMGDVQVTACDEALLVYNDHSAVVYDTTSWETIVRM